MTLPPLPDRTKLAWFAAAAWIVLLIAASIPAIAADLRQAGLVRLLAQVAAVQWAGSLSNPLACARPPLSSSETQAPIRAALAGLPAGQSNFHLVAAADCLLGEPGQALAVYRSFGSADLISALAQYVTLAQNGDPSAGLQALTAANLTGAQWLTAASVIIDREPQLDPRAVLRTLAERQPGERQVWLWWLQAGSRLQSSEGWASALAWYREGLQYPSGLQGSLAQRAGRIFQSAAVPRDYHAALAYYDLAIANDAFLSDADRSNTYMYRGETYQALPKEYAPAAIIREFERALEITPSSYWACLDLGNLYLTALKDTVQAEAYFRRALLLNKQTPNAYYYMGEVARANGDLAQAKTYYEQALALKPDWQAPQDRLKSLAAGK